MIVNYGTKLKIKRFPSQDKMNFNKNSELLCKSVENKVPKENLKTIYYNFHFIEHLKSLSLNGEPAHRQVGLLK